MKGGTSLMARLSFRSKLLLVLFVPFLALVVVAAAGLSDRFTALHAQEQYGDLSGPLHSLDDASRALQNESVVSSWYVAGTTAPPADELEGRRATRTDAAVRTFRANEQAFADRRAVARRRSPRSTATNRGFDADPRDARRRSTLAARDAARDPRVLPRASTATSSTSASASPATSPAPTCRPA